jgi:predicted nucleic acid-binding protein
VVTEASSALHEMAWRGEITKPRAKTMLDRLLKAPVELRTPDGLVQAAWNVADELGWAKTYDAHYVALARLLNLYVDLQQRVRPRTGVRTLKNLK